MMRSGAPPAMVLHAASQAKPIAATLCIAAVTGRRRQMLTADTCSVRRGDGSNFSTCSTGDVLK